MIQGVYVVRCDTCDTLCEDHGATVADARENAKALGWAEVAWRDHCPDCRKPAEPHCACGTLLDMRSAVVTPDAPGPVVMCQNCGNYVAVVERGT